MIVNRLQLTFTKPLLKAAILNNLPRAFKFLNQRFIKSGSIIYRCFMLHDHIVVSHAYGHAIVGAILKKNYYNTGQPVTIT